jgi:hypothetical protein
MEKVRTVTNAAKDVGFSLSMLFLIVFLITHSGYWEYMLSCVAAGACVFLLWRVADIKRSIPKNLVVTASPFIGIFLVFFWEALAAYAIDLFIR